MIGVPPSCHFTHNESLTNEKDVTDDMQTAYVDPGEYPSVVVQAGTGRQILSRLFLVALFLLACADGRQIDPGSTSWVDEGRGWDLIIKKLRQNRHDVGF